VCVQPFSLFLGLTYGPTPRTCARPRPSAVPARNICSAWQLPYDALLQLDCASHAACQKHGTACRAADSGLGELRAGKMELGACERFDSFHAAEGQLRIHTGKMKPPLKPASTVMEMATSLAKATATRILHQNQKYHKTQ
jgi:hypothetical protein